MLAFPLSKWIENGRTLAIVAIRKGYSPSRNDPQSLDGRIQGGMTQSFCLVVAIACDTASLPLPLFDSHYARAHFREKWAREVIARGGTPR